MTLSLFRLPAGLHVMKTVLCCALLLGACLYGCEADRALIPNTHDGRVPDVLTFNGRVDSSATRKFIVKLTWSFDSVRYGTDRQTANLRDWEVLRALGDTSAAFFQSRGRTFFPQFSDSSNEVQLNGRDSVVLYYRVIPAGFTVNNIQFIGKSTPPMLVIVRKW
jgi:hypothetical protein